MTTGLQHMEALAHGNRIRLKRAAVRRDIGAGRLSAIEVLESEIPLELEGWTLGKFLRAMKHWGPTRVERFLDSCSLPEKRTLGALTERQRRLLALELRRISGKRNKMPAK